MQKYNNGHVIDAPKIPISDYEIAAKQWAEGSKCLEELLLYCLKNNIVTQACCTGHKDGDMSFVQFELSEKNMDAIIKIINRYYNLNGVNMTFVNQPGVISKFDIRVPKNIGEQFFKDMLLQLSNGLNIGIDSISSDMRSTIDAMMKHKVPNEYLEVQYSMTDDRKKLFVATTNPNYSDLYWNKEQAKPWVENSISIEDTPEKIIPIINDISKKAPIQYSNYIESKRRVENQNAIISLSQQLEPEKNDIAEDDIVPIVTNAQATRENDYARKNSMTIVEVLPGMNIEQVAKAMCGKRYICKFNNFEIDGTKYTSVEQVVEAYNKDWEEGKKRFLESKKQQEQLDSSIRKQQIASVTNSQDSTLNEKLQVGGIAR